MDRELPGRKVQLSGLSARQSSARICRGKDPVRILHYEFDPTDESRIELLRYSGNQKGSQSRRALPNAGHSARLVLAALPAFPRRHMAPPAPRLALLGPALAVLDGVFETGQAGSDIFAAMLFGPRAQQRCDRRNDLQDAVIPEDRNRPFRWPCTTCVRQSQTSYRQFSQFVPWSSAAAVWSHRIFAAHNDP